MLRTTAVIGGSVAVSACWVPKETGVVMQRDIQTLQSGMQEAQKGLDVQRAQLTEQVDLANEQVQRVEKTLQDLNRAARMTDADFGVQMEQLRKEIQELRGHIELLTYRQGQLDAHFQGENSLLARIEALESMRGGDVAPATPAATKKPSKSTKPAATTKIPTDKAGLLRHARSLAKKGKTGDAKGVLRQIISKWPKSAGTTDAAFMELGGLYYKEKKYRSALQEYIKVAERFPKNGLADKAYYRIGECSMALSNYEDAKIFFDEVVRNHKKSSLAKPAQNKLREIDKRLAAEKKKRKGKGKK